LEFEISKIGPEASGLYNSCIRGEKLPAPNFPLQAKSYQLTADSYQQKAVLSK
jgi:hypothetical protein